MSRVLVLLFAVGCLTKPLPEGPDDDTSSTHTDTDTEADTDTDTDADTDADTDTGCEAPAVWVAWPSATRAAVQNFSASHVADLDGDGLLDLITCRDDVSWTLNPGAPWIVDGAWTSVWERTEDLGDYCLDLDVLDVEGDGDLDVLVTLSDTLVWLENDGGTLSRAGILAEIASNATLAVGDFDGDGRDDLSIAPVTLWNLGGGSFAEAPMPCGRADFWLSALPLVSDGRAVLFCGDDAFRAEADRTWRPVPVADGCTLWPIDQGPTRVRDLDGDGFADALMAGSERCLGDGSGALRHDGGLLSSLDTTWVTDLSPDFVLNDEGATGGDLHLFRAGVRWASLWLPYRLHQGGGALWRDLDGNGEADLLAWDGHDHAFYLYPSDGAGGFYTPWAAKPTSNTDHRATAADLDGDGVPEVIALTADTARVWWQDGPRTFMLGGAFTVPDGRRTHTPWPGGMDLDGDGDEEVVLTDPSFVVLDWDGSALVAHTPALPFSSYWSYQRPWAADLDGDGDAELIIENAAQEGGDVDGYDPEEEDPEAIRIGGLAEAGFPTTWTDLLLPSIGRDVVLALSAEADLDGDGKVDIALVDAGGVRVWAWDGAALGLARSSDLGWATSATDLEARRGLGATDADGDGDVDLWLALRDEAAVQILRNDGAGAFSLGDRVSAPAAMVDSEALRFEGGGAWTWNDGDGTVSAWQWTGAAFQALPQASVGIEDALTARDMDGDGLKDLVGAARDSVWVVWGVAEAGECE